MKCSKSIIAFFLSLAIVFSLCVITPSVSAAEYSGELINDQASAVAWDNWTVRNLDFSLLEYVISEEVFMWSYLDSKLAGCSRGEVPLIILMGCVTSWNGDGYLPGLGKQLGLAIDVVMNIITLNFSGFSAELAEDEALGVIRLREKSTGLWIVDSAGYFPYYKIPEQKEYIGQWVNVMDIDLNTDTFNAVSYSELSSYKENWADKYSANIVDAGDYYWLTWYTFGSVSNDTFVLCDEYGYPYYVPKDKNTAVSTPQNYYTDNSTTNNVYDAGDTFYDYILDLTGGTLNVGGQVYYVDDVTYDASTKTYFVDSHDQYTYNSTTNEYTTNVYNFEIQYNIDYTSVTYIGTTAEYDEVYEYYYELPDGRSSADLTAEDLEQLSVVFTDVVNYARSADDVNMRVLYHFDGNLEDSSFWSYATSFEWAKGASLTYMDEGTFGGSLYLDETEHEFTINLPGNDAAADWTLQFRYYQSFTAAPVQDSYLAVGENTLLQFTGSQYLNKGGTAICASSVGVWNEICLMRSGGLVYIYINGVYYASEACDYSQPTITFYFGAEQQTYKKLDELRFTKRALYTPEENYTPTAVPYDTNLTLILPDGEIPVADEVMVFSPSSSNMLIDTGMADWTKAEVLSSLIQYGGPSSATTPLVGTYLASNTTLTYVDGAVCFVSGTSAPSLYQPSIGNFITNLNDGIFLPVIAGQNLMSSSPVLSGPLSVNTPYCFSVVLADGSSSSIVFKVNNTMNGLTQVSALNNSSVVLSLAMVDQSNTMQIVAQGRGILLLPASGTTPQIMHMELVEGTAPKWSLRWDAAVYSSSQLTESPVLAVRTNRDITSYQIGGVRPSYPEKGMVYAMVESNRITSLQQYTGSAWTNCDGRIWTGSRWIPYSSFDVKTLQDLYDMVGTTQDFEYIYTETGFWGWWQKTWNGFLDALTSRHDEIIDAIKDVDGGTNVDIGDIFVDVDNTINEDGTENDDGWSFLDLMDAVKDGTWGFIKGLVRVAVPSFEELADDFDNVGSFFDYFDPDNTEGIFITESEGESIWD